jgi:rare lipoprotein A
MKKIFAFSLKILLYLIIVSQSIFAQEPNSGYASYYGKEFQGRKTASGEKYDMKKFTAAHRTLPFGTFLKITHLENNKSVVVKVNDRGPFSKKRVIDVSRAAAEKLGMIADGVARVSIEITHKIDINDTIASKNEPLPAINIDSSHISKQAKINNPPAEIITIEPGNFYHLSGKKAKPSGYGIQILSIVEIKKVLPELDSLKSKGFDHIFIEPKLLGEKKTYRIIIGEHSEKNSAEKERTLLEKNGYNGFVRRYIIK